jgi:predicted enzyme related to lactoylglutathione lyase
MHRSRLCGFIIDCQTDDLPAAATFWSGALGLPNQGQDGPGYIRLDTSARDLAMEVQAVRHPSRIHLDIETDDVEAEATRLEALGAKKVEKVRSWWVMEAPTGHRFCVVRAPHDLRDKEGVTAWG